MANFCTNCGNKLRKEDNFCTNCGTKIDKSDIGHNSHLVISKENIEKNQAKKELKRVVGGRLFYNKAFSNELYENGLDTITTGRDIRKQVEKEIDSGRIKSGEVEFRVKQLIHEYKIKNEEEKKKLKTINEIFESAEIKSEIKINNIDQKSIISIKDNLKDKLINKRENMDEEEIKRFIKTELEKIRKKQIEKQIPFRIAKEKEEMASKKTGNDEMNYGGYCEYYCEHYCEEIIDSGGGVTADYEDDICGVMYYCNLGHSLVEGRFCEDYE